ncbi:GDSL-type esterase/lipase family protein [Pseudomonas rhizophila]
MSETLIRAVVDGQDMLLTISELSAALSCNQPNPQPAPAIDENSTFIDEGELSGWTISNGTKTAPWPSWVRNTKTSSPGPGMSSVLSRPVSYPAASKDFIVYGKVRAKNAPGCFSVVWLMSGSKSLSIWFGSADAASASQGAISIRGSFSDALHVKQVGSGFDYESEPVEFALHFDSKFSTINCYFMRDGQPPEFRGRVRCEAFQAPTIQTVTGSGAPAYTWIEHDYLMVCRPNIIGIGDSIEDGRMGFSADPSINAVDGKSSWRAHALLLQGLRNRLVVNKGVPGNTSEQVLSRIYSDAVDNGPRYIVVGCSNNDYGSGVTHEKRTENIVSTVSAVSQSGIKCILRNSLYGSSSPIVGGSAVTNGAYRDYHKLWWDTQAAAISGVDYLIDPMTVLRNAADDYVNSEYLAPDGVHPNVAGYTVIGSIFRF